MRQQRTRALRAFGSEIARERVAGFSIGRCVRTWICLDERIEVVGAIDSRLTPCDAARIEADDVEARTDRRCEERLGRAAHEVHTGRARPARIRDQRPNARTLIRRRQPNQRQRERRTIRVLIVLRHDKRSTVEATATVRPGDRRRRECVDRAFGRLSRRNRDRRNRRRCLGRHDRRGSLCRRRVAIGACARDKTENHERHGGYRATPEMKHVRTTGSPARVSVYARGFTFRTSWMMIAWSRSGPTLTMSIGMSSSFSMRRM